MEMEFEWDEDKRRLNLEKHGIDFEDAIAIWEGNVVQSRSRQSHHSEERFLAYGLLEGRVICIVFMHRGGRIRIISARRARDHERENYQKAIERETEG
jgi:uncharacterized DUF497 family protein